MAKMKLCPIEPTDDMRVKGHNELKTQAIYKMTSATGVYKVMTAECPTVEVVDFEDFLFQQMKEIQTDPMISKRQDLKKIGLTVAQILDAHLKENGYQIIKKIEKTV